MARVISYDDAAHILRRMGFGGSPDQINSLASMSGEDAVNSLINYSNVDDTASDNLLKGAFDFSDPTNMTNFNPNLLRAWWVAKMVFTKRPFQEKMTLFWHNHFATALSKVQDTFMYIQNLTLRQHALDRFDTLLLQVAQDPAMLIWLDGITNVAAKPNENFARELQELFTMGIKDVVTGEANYTQADVIQVARAFTGWTFHRTAGGGPYDYTFAVNAAQHDNGSKTIYGQAANFKGEDVITIIANRMATPRFLVKKLFEFFVYPLDITNSGDAATIDKFASVYMANDHSILALVQAIFTSDEFFGDRARFGLVKNPIEFIVGSIRMLGATYNPGTASPARHDGSLYQGSANMGMDMFDPPNVAGWNLNGGFIDTAAMLYRFNFANSLISSRPGNPSAATGAFVTANQLSGFARANAKKTARNLLQAFGPLLVDGGTFKSLRTYLQTDDTGNFSFFDSTNSAIVDERLRGAIHLTMSLPEYNLN
ncbi:MAG TPA: DUF1800 domain-containing protein [Blastocatellia bacterium]|nr:DUF1800 domain-containing protein [Blastocatellia bacterium]